MNTRQTSPNDTVKVPLVTGRNRCNATDFGLGPAIDSDRLHALRLDAPVIMTPRHTIRHQVRKAAVRPRLLPRHML